jgi:hypothetical protein
MNMSKKSHLQRNVSQNGYAGKVVITILCCIIILLQLSCKKQPSSQVSQTKAESSSIPKSPDLRNCTRVEMKFMPSTKDFICSPFSGYYLFDTQEIEYLESIDKLVLSDPNTIKVLSEDMSSAVYERTENGIPGIANYIMFTCYNENESIIAFTTYGSVLDNFTMGLKHMFKCNIRLNLIAPKLQMFRLRFLCADNLKGEIKRSFNYYKSYPPSAEWCDSIIKRYELGGYNKSVSDFKEALICPSAGEGKCHYAMNPNCRPDSPKDMVLLFETKDGWNQNGGPELFTFDNHDPKGGCVLFNDGSVKFIRTEEELNNLKWK